MEPLATTKINPTGPEGGRAQVSFSPFNESSLIVTGGGLYKFFIYKDKQIKDFHSQMNDARDPDIGTRYSCHTWSADGRLIVCTRDGEMIICGDNGEFKLCMEDSPRGVDITCITQYARGLVVAGSKGEIFTYEKTDDIDIPFKFSKKLDVKVDRAITESPAITSMAITSTEDVIYFTLENNQLMKL